MRKLLIAVAVAAMSALASCQEAETPQPDGDYVEVMCGITTDDPDTRAFFDNNSRPEAWETELKSVTIFGYTASGTRLLRYEMTPAEIAAGQVRLRLIKVAYDFYVVANYDVPAEYNSRSKMTAKHENLFAEYNGTAAEVMGACKRVGGFVMTGKLLGVDPTQVTSFTCGLKRSVAKSALRVTVAQMLSTAYPNGKLRLDNARFTGMSMNTTLFTGTYEIRNATTYFVNQAPVNPAANVWDNLFYAYWNPATATCPKITLTGVFDRDGNFATTGDQQAVTYTVSVNPNGDGSIAANGYYRIEANIRQLP